MPQCAVLCRAVQKLHAVILAKVNERCGLLSCARVFDHVRPHRLCGSPGKTGAKLAQSWCQAPPFTCPWHEMEAALLADNADGQLMHAVLSMAVQVVAWGSTRCYGYTTLTMMIAWWPRNRRLLAPGGAARGACMHCCRRF